MLNSNLSVTIITCNSKLKNISFNEKELSKHFLDALKNMVDDNTSPSPYPRINQIYSNQILPIISKNIDANPITSFRKCFNSQITFVVETEKKIYNIKVFRSGSIGIPGVLDVDDLKIALTYLVNKMIEYQLFLRTDIELEPVSIKMNNYKTHFVLENDQFIHIPKLKYILCDLMKNHTNGNIINAITINENKNNSLSIKVNINHDHNRPKTYLIEIFVSGKICIKGQMDIELAKKHLDILENIILSEDNGIIQNRNMSSESIIKILNESSYDKIDVI